MNAKCCKCGAKMDVDRLAPEPYTCFACVNRARDQERRERAVDQKRLEARRATKAGMWPKFSWGAGCHPRQTKQFQEHLLKHGCGHVEINERGYIKMESRGHRNAILRALGMRDNDAGYGDHSGR